MLSYILRKVSILIFTLWIVITLSFFILRLAPGGPFDTDRPMSKEVKEMVLKHYGMDKPLYQQYFSYLGSVVRFDLGPSLKLRDFTVIEIIKNSAPTSAFIGVVALIIGVMFGLLLGTVAALNKNTRLDYIIVGSTLGTSMLPSFALIPILTLLLGVYVKIFPVAGWYGWQYAILPIFVLAIGETAWMTRVFRGTMLDVLSSNYIKTAYAKGLTTSEIILKHALKPAILPIVSLLGVMFAGIIMGSLIVEKLFDIPGLGRFLVQASFNRDYPLVLGGIIFYSSALLIFNFFVDILYVWLVPKAKLE